MKKRETDNYKENSFKILCGKALEQLIRKNDVLKQFEILSMMKNVLQMDQVRKLTDMEQ